ncbi:MAG: protein-L-isoaspartate(D-aspartate) O-methyltransferase [Chloroflexia bacterium]
MRSQHAASENAAHGAEERRRQMVVQQLAERGIHDTRVLEAMSRLPRDRFLAPDLQHLAYSDAALPIAEQQTISQPYMVAVMTEALRLTGAERVLEIGTGSGYQAAVLGMLAREVISVERRPFLAERAGVVLTEFGFRNITVVIGDGSQGWPPRAPYDAIIVTAGAPEVPTSLISQLAPGGRLVIPVGAERQQMLMRLTKQGNREDQLRREELMPCLFVPLIGAMGWKTPD